MNGHHYLGRALRLLALASASSVVACAGDTVESGAGGAAGASGGGAGGVAGVSGGGAGGAAGGAGTAGASGASGSAGSSGSACPDAPPAQGASCTAPWTSTSGGFVGSHCSWGDDPRPQCRTTASCHSGAWAVTQAEASCAGPPLPAQCPSPPPADTTECGDASLACWYGDGTHCWCSPCAGGSGYPVCQTIDPPQWYCGTPAAGCPTILPQAGAACDVPGASCGPSCELVIRCEGGVWQWLHGDCPICAAPDTPIATPAGERAIAALRPGDLVYSVDRGDIAVVPVLRVGRTPVSGHRVVRVELDSGAELEISAGHPTWDGRTFGDLRESSWLDGEHRVESVARVPYAHDATYDILPDSDTGPYFAAGALIGSTMFR